MVLDQHRFGLLLIVLRKGLIFVSFIAVTWNVTCTYSQFLAQKTPACCVSLSSFYNETIVNCPTCSCGCQNNITNPGSCVEWVPFYFILFHILLPTLILICKTLFMYLEPLWCFICILNRGNSPYLQSAVNGPGKNSFTPLVQCTSHMCPIRVHWHVKLNYKDYWRVKITVTNFNYRMNYTQWNIVAQHPNFDNITTVFSFNYKPITPYGAGISKPIIQIKRSSETFNRVNIS